MAVKTNTGQGRISNRRGEVPLVSRREWLRAAASATALLTSAGSLKAWGKLPVLSFDFRAKKRETQERPLAKIHFSLQTLPFRVDSDETLKFPHAPATMAGGCAVFDYNKDGRPDIFFTNGANIETLKKNSPRFSNRLFRNDGKGSFTDVTKEAGLAGTGYDIAAAVGDYDNDGYPDLFVGGVHGNTLYHNNGDGTFSDVTARAGLDRFLDPQYGPLWTAAAAWVDVNNDGLLDLVVINYLRWDIKTEKLCPFAGSNDYCSPQLYQGQPNQLFLNRGDGTFEDVSGKWGLRGHVGKGMGVGVADYDLDGRPDLFVANDTSYNFLFHNSGEKFEEVAFQEGVALDETGNFISGMGVDFRDCNNDGYPDIIFVALNNQTFPLFLNKSGKGFDEVGHQTGLRELTRSMAGYGAGFFDFDNDGWKDLFVSCGHVESIPTPAYRVNQHNAVFRNPGPTGKWEALTTEAGLAASPPARHRGCAFGDLDGDGRVDVVVTALGREAEIWMNRSPDSGHWLDVALEGTKSNRDGIGARIKLVTSRGTQFNHMTTSVGYASSSHGPVHFGLGANRKAELVEIHWPSGIVQSLRNVEADRVLTVKESASNK
jgi:enediyne biosynthesis protein E4